MKVKESKRGFGFEIPLDKPMVFTTGYSGDNMLSSQVEIELDGGMDETKKRVEATMEAVITEVKASKTQLGEVVALTALKISKASLKHIDPKLRS